MDSMVLAHTTSAYVMVHFCKLIKALERHQTIQTLDNYQNNYSLLYFFKCILGNKCS